MESSKALAKRFTDVVIDGTWIANTNIQEQIRKVDWKKATTQVGSLNSIAALTFHLNYYIAGVLNVFEGGELEIRDKYSFDMPEIKSNEDWDQLRNSIVENSQRFAAHVEQMSEETLESGFVNVKYGSYRRNIEAMIEHCYYHFGQMTIINKMLAEQGIEK